MSAITKPFNWLNNLSWISILLIGISLAGSYLLWEQYQEQLFGYLPYVFLLLCPLMHVFMHRGHGRHENHESDRSSNEEKKDM